MKGLVGVLLSSSSAVRLRVLGVAQDAGVPHPRCYCANCCRTRTGVSAPRHATALAVIDVAHSPCWFLFEATPHMPEQLHKMQLAYPDLGLMSAVFLSHAHIGHYTGLMYLGREAMATSGLPVYAGERMQSALRSGPPWQQLINLKNIELRPLHPGIAVSASPQVTVTPLAVPHRNEYSETYGFVVTGPRHKALFIPDIDSWSAADFSIAELAGDMDYCFIDATFFSGDELPGRDLREIPHPLVKDSMHLLQSVSDAGLCKIYFIHLNHSNPLLDAQSLAHSELTARGFAVAWEGMEVEL